MDDYIQKTIAVYDAAANAYALQASTRCPSMQRKLFASLIKKGGSILDAGCGSGRDSVYFVEQGFQVTGIDLSNKLLAIAKKSAPKATFVLGDLRHMPFQEKQFDAIWACASILHIQHSEMEKVFQGFFSVLQHGGILYVHVKKGEGESYLEEPSIPEKKRFFSFFTGKQLEEYCKKAGFSDVEIIDLGYTTAYADGKHSKEWIDCFAKKL